jgi:hypothetical protein
MDALITQGGVVGILVLLIIDRVLTFVQRRNGKGNSRAYAGDCALSKVCEMRHTSLRDLITHVNDNLTAQPALLRDVAGDVKCLKGKVR